MFRQVPCEACGHAPQGKSINSPSTPCHNPLRARPPSSPPAPSCSPSAASSTSHLSRGTEIQQVVGQVIGGEPIRAPATKASQISPPEGPGIFHRPTAGCGALAVSLVTPGHSFDRRRAFSVPAHCDGGVGGGARDERVLL